QSRGSTNPGNMKCEAVRTARQGKASNSIGCRSSLNSDGRVGSGEVRAGVLDVACNGARECIKIVVLFFVAKLFQELHLYQFTVCVLVVIQKMNLQKHAIAVRH